MALRSLWKGSLRFSLVTIGVEAFTAAQPDEGEIHLNQLHDTCHSRIRYQKVCPIHGEVRNDEIVTGYEYEKDHYVVVDREEAKQAQSDERTIAIDTFIAPEEIDPLYFGGQSYYLLPDKPGAAKPYAVLHDAMAKLDRWGVATVVLHGKERLLAIRPIDGLLTMAMLHFHSQIRSPEVVESELPSIKATPQELKLAQQLIESSTDSKFNFSKYDDRYTDRLKELIDAKLAGKETIETPEMAEEVPIINLMDALRKSVKKTKQSPQAKQARKALTSRLARQGVPNRQQRRKTS